MTDEELEAFFINHKSEIVASNNVSDIKELKDQLTTIREKGVAFDDEEQNPGIRGISSGIRDSEGHQIGAITVAAPSVRLTRAKMRNMAPIVKSTAQAISKELGFNG